MTTPAQPHKPNPIDLPTLRARLIALSKRVAAAGDIRASEIVAATAERIMERCSCEQEPPRSEFEGIVREKFPDSSEDAIDQGIAALRRWHRETDPLKPPPESVGCMRSRDFWHGFAVGWERAIAARPAPFPDEPPIVLYCENGHPRTPCAIERHSGLGIAYTRAVCPTCMTIHYDSNGETGGTNGSS